MYAAKEKTINRKMEELGLGRGGRKLKDLFGGKKKQQELDLVTFDDLRLKFERNVTNGHHIAWYASTTTDHGLHTSVRRPAEINEFIRDPLFDGWSIVVYHDPKSQVAWMGVAGNRAHEAVTMGKTGASKQQEIDEAMRLFQLGTYTHDALMKSPRYQQTEAALDKFLEKYAHYRHRKVAGHSTGCTMLLHYMRSNPGRNQSITWASLFNTPMANGRIQQKYFKKFLKRNKKVLLVGTEFDMIDPNHYLYTDDRAFVLGYLDNPALNATLDKYEAMKLVHPMRWGPAVGHSLEVTKPLQDIYYSPRNPEQFMRTVQDPPAAPIEATFAENVQRKIKEVFTGKKEPRTIEELLSITPTTIKPAKKPDKATPKYDKRYGYVPVLVQYGGKSGLGEGEEFIAYQWVTPPEHDKYFHWAIMVGFAETLFSG